MSASSKKKLRKEEAAARMTERQAAEQKEAKKLKTYSIIFGVVMALMLVFAIWTGVSKTVTNSGILERSNVAVTVGDHEISSAELNIYYFDAINEFYSTYGSYASLFGLDVTAPLNEQVTNEETGATWADDFLTSAIENLKFVYGITDIAAAEGYTLTEDELAEIESNMDYVELYALYYYGYTDAESYLKAMYGNGCTEKLYREYLEMNTLATSYYNNYYSELSYEDSELRAAESENYNAYSSYSYSYYTLSVSKFLEGGTTDSEGNVTYSDEERAAALAAAEAAAIELTGEDITDLNSLNKAIAGLAINAGAETAPTANTCEDYLYSNVSTTMQEWVTDDARQAGDVTYLTNESTSTDDAGNETTTVSSYIVVMFHGSNDNTFALANVRHILVAFEGGTTDDSGNTTYSEDEIAAAKTAAEELLAQWKAGEATEESFAALANENSDDGDGTTGGLYEDIYPGQMVEAFENWCLYEGHKAGDTGIVETEYGYHVMYYSGDSETTYRDYMITNELKSADLETWYNALIESMVSELKNTKYISMDLVLSSN